MSALTRACLGDLGAGDMCHSVVFSFKLFDQGQAQSFIRMQAPPDLGLSLTGERLGYARIRLEVVNKAARPRAKFLKAVGRMATNFTMIAGF